jgi:type VI secretion system secreted protein VgrG
MPIFELQPARLPSDGSDALSVRHVSIKEALHTPFQVGVMARSSNQDIRFASVVGEGIRLTIRGDGERASARTWSGICSFMEQIEAEPTGLSTYFLQIVPRLWLLSQRRSCRIFQHVTLPRIMRMLLEANGVQARFQIDEGAYRQLEYRVQYNETDLDFFHRILEEAGVTYFFSDESGDTELVLADAPETRTRRARPIRFVGDSERHADGEVAYRVTTSEAVVPGRFRVRDYDFRNPSFSMIGQSPAAEGPEAALDQFGYGPGHSWVLAQNPQGGTPVADDQGAYRGDQTFADERARHAYEGIRAAKRQVGLETNVLDLAAGVVFGLVDHPHSDLARPLLVVSSSIEGAAEGQFFIGARAHFADVPHRPALATRRPRILGPQSAVVVGPSGEEIHVDEFGRVRVQFFWDPEATSDEHSSCWIRVSQGWAGAGYGMTMLPRVGQEVLVGFLDGDPDQPIVVGRVHNANEQVPYPLPRNKTVSTWKSRSTPSSDGFNEIKFDDDAGNELVYIQAEKDLRKLVKHNENITVRGSRSAGIGSVNSIHAGTKHEVTIAQPDPPPPFPPTRFTMIDRKITLTTGEATIELDGPNITLSAKGDIALSAGGAIAITALGTGTMPGPPAPITSGHIEITAAQKIGVVSVGQMTVGSTNEIHIAASEKVLVSSPKEVVVSAGTTMTLSATAANDISGAPVNLNGPGQPAGRVGDPASGVILSGSSTVLIGGVPSAIPGPNTSLGPFASADDAARAVLNHANPQSIRDNREYVGLIWQDPATGQYYATNPQRQGLSGGTLPTSRIPPGGREVGMYHTHGDYSTLGGTRTTAANDQFNSENFSGTDTRTANSRGRGNPNYRSYLGTPSGRQQVYNPSTGRTSPL